MAPYPTKNKTCWLADVAQTRCTHCAHSFCETRFPPHSLCTHPPSAALTLCSPACRRALFAAAATSRRTLLPAQTTSRCNLFPLCPASCRAVFPAETTSRRTHFAREGLPVDRIDRLSGAMALPTLGMRSAAGCTGPGRPRLWLRLALPLRPSDRLRLERADSWPSRFSDWSNADTRIEPEPRPGTPRAASSTRCGTGRGVRRGKGGGVGKASVGFQGAAGGDKGGGGKRGNGRGGGVWKGSICFRGAAITEEREWEGRGESKGHFSKCRRSWREGRGKGRGGWWCAARAGDGKGLRKGWAGSKEAVCR
eukprot:269097-Chlamydomonas_euryale.AAC.8